jgi:transposase
MWTVENRKRCERSHVRYPSDLTDEEWQHVEPLIPLAKPGGRKRGEHTRSRQRRHVRAFDGMPVAVPTKGSAPRKARCSTTSIVGTVMERWRLSITTSM